MTDFAADDPRMRWSTQETELFRLTPDELQALLGRSRRRLRRKSHVMYAGAIVEIVGLAGIAIAFSDPVLRTGALLTIVAFLFMIAQLRLHRPLHNLGPIETAATGEPLVAVVRADLERQRDFFRGIGLASRLVIAVPSGLIVFIGMARVLPDMALVMYASAVAFVVLAVVVGVPVSLRRARRYQAEIDELDALSA